MGYTPDSGRNQIVAAKVVSASPPSKFIIQTGKYLYKHVEILYKQKNRATKKQRSHTNPNPIQEREKKG